jgi:hypothetical protein
MLNLSDYVPVGWGSCPKVQCACGFDLMTLAGIFIMDVGAFLFICWLFRKEIAWLMGRFKKPEKPKSGATVKQNEDRMVDSGFAGNYWGGGRREP